MMSAAKRIGIAVVEHDNRYLVGIRGPGIPLAGFAEFPGGKFLEKETPEDCAIRECLEEAGLAVTAYRLLERREFEYPHGRVDLHFMLCHPVRPQDVREHHGEFHWATVVELKSMKFPEANADIVTLLEEYQNTEAQRRRENEERQNS
jgi:mutator protein MutT